MMPQSNMTMGQVKQFPLQGLTRLQIFLIHVAGTVDGQIKLEHLKCSLKSIHVGFSSQGQII
jgi:hypothetical protein